MFGASHRRPVRPHRAPTPSPRRSRPALEALEDRVALSLGSEFGVATPLGIQRTSDNASSTNGMAVAVWVDRISASNTDIKAQRFNSAGQKVGGVISVATSGNREDSPSVAMDSTGDFVVTWVRTLSNGDDDVLAARYSSSGAQRGGTIIVANSTKDETEPSVAVSRLGDFVIAYTLQFNSTDQDVKAAMYRDNGSLISTFTVAGSSSLDERHPSVARTPDGRFAVAYQRDNNGSNPDVILRRYSATGSLVNTHNIATSSGSEFSPRVAMDDSGNSVVAWYQIVGSDRDIKARKVSSGGVLGSTITVRNTTRDELFPSVAMHRTNGSFVVAYTVGFTNASVEVVEVNASGSIRSTRNLGSTRRDSALSMGSNGRYFLTYTQELSSSDHDIRGRFGLL
jgi:hypothetical protein